MNTYKSVAVVHNPRRFWGNRLETFRIILLRNKRRVTIISESKKRTLFHPQVG